jgi:hypothetical protein
VKVLTARILPSDGQVENRSELLSSQPLLDVHNLYMCAITFPGFVSPSLPKDDGTYVHHIVDIQELSKNKGLSGTFKMIRKKCKSDAQICTFLKFTLE